MVKGGGRLQKTPAKGQLSIDWLHADAKIPAVTPILLDNYFVVISRGVGGMGTGITMALILGASIGAVH